ncbi:galacturonosyltransferase [Tessaracoccus flavus]|nr:galacturonosyltransferase [Tessaracoccus flavus]
MARVLVFANDYTSVFHFRRELLRRLVSDGHAVELVLPVDDRNQAFAEIGCSVTQLPLSRFGTNPIEELGTLVRFMKIVRSARPDVLVTFTAKPNIYGGIASQICRVPLVSAVTGLGATFQQPGFLRTGMTLLYRLALRGASRVMFENSSNRQLFLDRHVVAEGNSTVVSGAGVNLAENPLVPYPEKQDVTRFIAVARVRRDKGYDQLFEAIKQVCAHRDDVEFHIVGWYEDESYRQRLLEVAADYPVIVHGGVSQEQVRGLLAQADCLIHPSHHEGMANVILEASAAGRPCLVSDIPGCREAVDSEVSGFLFPAKDAPALAECVERFTGLPTEQRRQMGLAARQKMELEFGRDAVVDSYVAAIMEAA